MTPPPFGLQGQRILVTGASGGVGGGIARRLAAAGAKVVVHWHQAEAAARAVAAQIADAGGSAVLYQADLSDPALVGWMIEGAGPITALVNNAGLQPVSAFDAVTPGQAQDLWQMNVAVPFALTQAFARARAGQGGAVVNIASIEGLQPAAWHAAYTQTKAALIMQTRNAALELGPQGVRVNAISPGLIDAGGLADAWPEGVARWQAAAPLGRLGTPEDIGDAAVFLCSAAARWITGANLVVDGGVLTRNTW